MARPDRFSARWEQYRHQTHRPLHCLVYILPLLVFFHVGTAFYGSDLLAPRHIGKILSYFGATVAYLPAALIVVVLLLQHVVQRDRFAVRPAVLAGMLAESVLWTLPLIATAYIAGRPWAQQATAPAAAPAASRPILQQAVLAVGAGVYEEFVFRLVLISLMLLLLVDVFELRRDLVTVIVVVLTAGCFGLYHFSAADLTAAGFPWHDLVFFALAGVYLGGLYVFRGFGIAVGAHAIYNLYSMAYHVRG